MDPQLCKLFHNFGDIYDDPKARSFIKAHPNATGVEGSLLLVNQANPRIDLCDWISSSDVDLGKCKRAFRANLPILVNASAGVSVSFSKKEKSVIGSAAVLENENTIAFDTAPGFHRLVADDARLFDAIENDYSELNIVEQVKDSLEEPEIDCFGIFGNGALAAFASVAPLRGSMFADSYSISGIFTVQAYRKNGYAASLLKSILHTYHGKQFYYTATPATNMASIRLAQSCGFTPVGKTITHQFTA